MMAPKVLLLVEDEAVSGAIRFALEVEEIEVMILASFKDLLREASIPGTCAVIDKGSDGTEGLGFLDRLRAQGVRGGAVILASTPARGLDAAVSARGGALVEKPLLCDELVETIRGFSREAGEER